MQKNFYMFLFIIGIIASSVIPLNAQGWLNNWNYRCEVVISNSGAALSEYQVRINLNKPLIFANAKIDGSDVRMTNSDGNSLLPFWIESWNAGGNLATIWAKIPVISANTTTTIYLYYGNASATSVSSGQNTFEFFDDFEAWNISSGSTGWADITSTPDPPKADNTTAVYNNKLYVFGGYGTSSGDLLNEVFEYDPSTSAWTTKTDMPTARWGMVAVEFNGLIYVFAGQGTANNKNEVYNPANDTWDVSKAPVPANLAQQGLMGVKYGDKIHLFYRSYHYEYDPATDSYTQKANVPRQVTWSTCATVGSKIYIIGGYSYDPPTDACDVNYEYDPATDTWLTKAPMPVSRYGATRENPVINGKIYVTHGHAGTPFFVTNYAYDPATNNWEQKGPAAYPRDGVGCGVIYNKLYVIGGRDVPNAPYGVAWSEVYDPTADTWIPPSGQQLWSTSGTAYVNADVSAKYQGNYGLKISNSGSDFRYAQSVNGFGNNYVLDLNWNVTSLGSGTGTWPETEIRVSELPDYPGNIYFYNISGTQTLRWYNGSFTTITSGTKDSWHNVSFVRNGANNTITFDGTAYGPYTGTGYGQGTGIFRFGQFMATTQYLDNVRVRKYASIEPATIVNDPLPVELSSFSTSIIGSSVKLNWRTETEVNNYGFEIERKVGSGQSSVGNYEKIGFVNGNGNSNSPKSYSFEDNALTPGKYSYRLKQIDNDGQFEYSKTIEVDFNSPKIFELSQNYPNPFNPKTTIRFSIPEAGNVKISLYNPLGQEVSTILNEVRESGTHIVNFDASELNSGMYIYKLESGSFIQTRKMILLK
ncbi:MAG: DUF2341 domain-containing protein [Ignavibacterium sp.]|nr:DUF2341 domain-containing protein [Ignavibacterium sp.]